MKPQSTGSEKERVLTYEEYEALEETSEVRHIFHEGEVHAMAGGSADHAAIAVNVLTELRNSLKGAGCRVFNSDLRIHIPRHYLDVYPDISIVCGDPRFLSEKQTALLNPILIVEILSPSTERYDRGGKFAYYRSLESLREYVLVAQEYRSVEVFRRNEAGIWELHDAVEGAAEFSSVGCRVSLEEIYAGITFDERPRLRSILKEEEEGYKVS